MCVHVSVFFVRAQKNALGWESRNCHTGQSASSAKNRGKEESPPLPPPHSLLDSISHWNQISWTIFWCTKIEVQSNLVQQTSEIRTDYSGTKFWAPKSVPQNFGYYKLEHRQIRVQVVRATQTQIKYKSVHRKFVYRKLMCPQLFNSGAPISANPLCWCTNPNWCSNFLVHTCLCTTNLRSAEFLSHQTKSPNRALTPKKCIKIVRQSTTRVCKRRALAHQILWKNCAPTRKIEVWKISSVI